MNILPFADQRFDGPPPASYISDVSPREVHASVRWQLIESLTALYGQYLSFNRKADLALAIQEFAGQRVLSYVNELLGDLDVLVLSGGFALNCAINAQVAEACRSRGVELVIPPPASDTGVALGAAIASAESPSHCEPLTDPYLGRMYFPEQIAAMLHREEVTIESVTMEELAAELVERHLVCGWFEGRSEIGPRALGKRCIIACPDSTALRDRINYVKGRESRRPLAPSLTAEEFSRSFSGSTSSPYMLVNATVVPALGERLKGLTHVDDTSRPQVVTTPGAYLDLLKAIGALIGSEALICASFNRAGEPNVYTPLDALHSAQAMKLDMLAGDGWCVRL